ncbi:hypothetical protein [Gaetbulibacter saemankumensis]|uniref:hypothetical protein n=1 Tax=Gaetbulibacter saemankumensis TaxID=311208 RepID=UPI00040C5AD8|nr:hypothetical protein [Gaetbulibacter saemankumensis]
MKRVKLLLILILSSSFLTSCYNEVVVEEVPPVTLYDILDSYELWYVDINSTVGYGETPFLQKAFTISFLGNAVYANNNIVGLGDTGNGFGVKIGNFDAYEMILDVNHVIDGIETFDVYQVDYNTIELYNPYNDTSYFLDGYQRTTFDYDFVYYDNIHYFLQEYVAWEKTYTSTFGVINEFDSENYLQFLAGGNDSTFFSSQDPNGTSLADLIWDYEGVYGVGNVANDMYLKILTLDYDFFNNEYFELSVINDRTIELFHPSSETVYEFTGRSYIQYLKQLGGKGSVTPPSNKMRKHRKDKVANPRDNTRV